MTSFLGIDTSNYRTSAALYHAENGTYQNSGRLLPVDEGKLGLRQSDALFLHCKALPDILAQLDGDALRSVAALGVSTRPRDLEESYMPCFLAGASTAESIALCRGIERYSFSHQQGHIAAAALSCSRPSLLRSAFLSWHLSGGTSELLLVQPDRERLLRAQRIGGTTDLAAGQLIDRAGVMLGLPFPAGPALDTLSRQAVKRAFFRPKVTGFSFSVSGIENKIRALAAEGESAAEIAYFAIKTLLFAVTKISAAAVKEYGLPLLCAGGVMANTLFREELPAVGPCFFAEPALSGDNAVGLAYLAYRRYTEGEPHA